MALSVDDLFTPPTEAQVLETFLSELETLGLPSRSWRVGGVARTILRVVAKTYAGFASIMAEAIRAGFLETARGKWLTLLALNVFNVTRREATFATGDLQLTNTGGGIYSYGADEARFLKLGATADTRTYTNVEAFTLGAGDVLTIAIRAVEVGADSSAPPGTITGLETVMFGVEVTNPEAVVGSDEEGDPELRQRCRDKLGAISVRGPRGAYAYAVSSAVRDDGSPVDINRSSISPSSSTGVVTIYCASPAGAPEETDLEYVRASVEAIARPDSVTANVLPVVEVPLERELIVWAKRTDGVDADDLETFVSDALLREITAYPIGGIPKPPSTQGYLYADFISGVVKGAHVSIYDVDGAGADEALDPGEVATLATTLDIRIVDVP